MARQTSIIKFTGKLGDTVGYRNGKNYCLRSHAAVKQTAATKKTAKDFGTASKAGRLIRHSLHKMNDTSHINRLNKVLGEIVRADMQNPAGQRKITDKAIHKLSGFRFNSYAGISCTPVIEKTNQEISISVTDNSKHAIRAIAITINFQQQTTKVTSVDYDGQQPMILKISDKDITLILLELSTGSNNRKQYSLDIIAVYPPQKQKLKKQNSIPQLMLIPRYTKRVTKLTTRITSPPGG